MLSISSEYKARTVLVLLVLPHFLLVIVIFEIVYIIIDDIVCLVTLHNMYSGKRLSLTYGISESNLPTLVRPLSDYIA